VLRDGDMGIGSIGGADVDSDWLHGLEQSLEFNRDQVLVEAGNGFGWHGHA
jgi:hypothetical protein